MVGPTRLTNRVYSIYNLVALALRGYILSWYTRFSKDRALLPSIHSTIIHPILSPILTSVYDNPERIVKWILRDLLCSVEIHVKVYWEAKAALGAGTLGDRYHARLPLPSVTASSSPAPYSPVDPTYTLSSEYLTSLSVALIQPTETEEERSQMGLQGLMIREVLARAILAGGMRRLCFGWFWYGLILKLLGEPGDPFPWRRTTPQKQDEPESLHQLVLSYMRTIITLFTTIYSAIVALIAVYTAAPPPSPEYEGCTDTLMGMMREMVGVDGYAGIEAKKWRKRMVWGGVEMAVGLTSPVLDRYVLLFHVFFPSPLMRPRVTAMNKLTFFVKALSRISSLPSSRPNFLSASSTLPKNYYSHSTDILGPHLSTRRPMRLRI